MIPNAVYNEHSGNTYWLDNSIAAADVQPNLVYGSALDNPRPVAVRGTFLQNRDYLEMYYQGRYTVVDLQAGPSPDPLFHIHHPHPLPLPASPHIANLRLHL